MSSNPLIQTRLEELITSPALLQQVKAADKTYGPAVQQLILDVAEHVAGSYAPTISGNGPAISKKRKLEESNGTSAGPQKAPKTESEAPVTFWCKDVSFAIPARKKLRLEILGEEYSGMQSIRAVNQQTNQVEYSMPAEDIDHTFCLPVPEKATRQQNFVIYPRETATSTEPFVFAISETPIKDDVVWSAGGPISGVYTTAIAAELTLLLSSQNKSPVTPSEQDFASAIPQPHRKNEAAYHVKAHRGSKDGFLFFLSNGILFGFKKPLAFYPFSCIQSISYTSVLQRTFNLVISIQAINASPEEADAAVAEHEYSMLDQADFAGIDEYVKRHALNDASMAEQRRAKVHNVNKTNGAEVEDGTELQKAEKELERQDAGEEFGGEEDEDEEGEDYDPGSEGESEGSGSESGDEEGDGEGYEEVEEEE